jgi:hypothetical protein
MTDRQIRGSRLLLEGLVVVASILIAFALDAWWSQRAEERTEAAHLRALRTDFQANVARLQSLIAREEATADASRRLLVVASTPRMPSAEDSLANLLGRVLNSGRFDPVMGAYEAVVSSGGLAQVQDDSLRLALADFASLVQGRYTERYSDELYFDFVRSFTGRLGLSSAVLALDPSQTGRAVSSAGYNLQLLSDPKFHEHLALRYFAERDVASAYRGLLGKAERVLMLTEQALR